MLSPRSVSRRSFGSGSLKGRRLVIHNLIFGGDSPQGRLFDEVLIVVILASVAAVMLESVETFGTRFHSALIWMEWGFTIIFTVEYALRLACVGRPLQYARSFYGIIDLLAVLPTYLSLVLPGAHALLVIRLLRILRVFRVLKLVKYLTEADFLLTALRNSRRKITIFILAVLTLVTILGSLVYLIEGAENGFENIPVSVYWAIVTLTTVGYGDISPQTPLGQALAAVVMIIGYAIIAVPTGIVTAELAKSRDWGAGQKTRVCSRCYFASHGKDAKFCSKCGKKL